MHSCFSQHVVVRVTVVTNSTCEEASVGGYEYSTLTNKKVVLVSSLSVSVMVSGVKLSGLSQYLKNSFCNNSYSTKSLCSNLIH